MNEFFNMFAERKYVLLDALIEHIQISFIALLIAGFIAVPLGIYITKKAKIAEFIIGITAVLQTIPSLALLGLLIPLIGIGKIPAIVALVAYGLLPILRNTYTGIKEVDDSLIEAADAMGMNKRKKLVKVELPLAMPVIMAGIRTSMVLIVGTATLAALIGAGGLGDIILLGIDRNNTYQILLGAIPAALLAIVFDYLLKKMENLSYKKAMITIAGIVVIAFIMIVSPLFMQQDKEIVIAGKLGAEPEILINMYKILIEEETDIQVELKPGFGKTSFVFNALDSGSIDIYPEFSGTALMELLKETPQTNDAEEIYEQAREGMQDEFHLTFLEPMAFNNTYALAVTKELADEYELETISDLKGIEDHIDVGFTLEFSDREDGYLGIQELYDIEFPHITTMEPKLRYVAVESGEINLVDAYSTDSELEEYELVVLEDDQELFPPYQGAPLIREEVIEEHPELEDVLNQLAENVTDDDMRKMNYQVNVDEKDPYDVAEEFLIEADIID